MVSAILMLQRTRDQFQSEAIKINDEINQMYDRILESNVILGEYIKNVEEIEVALKLLEASNGSKDQEVK